ncbi:hypothetical protein AB1Y20_014975 [Prymnesium parvum]|uniref:Glycosyltransferase 2-like domain-containing protein n=1 Tax=Prymnesium parvum TaxID=97485 RepID=A0AB34K003_PRYPA
MPPLAVFLASPSSRISASLLHALAARRPPWDAVVFAPAHSLPANLSAAAASLLVTGSIVCPNATATSSPVWRLERHGAEPCDGTLASLSPRPLERALAARHPPHCLTPPAAVRIVARPQACASARRTLRGRTARLVVLDAPADEAVALALAYLSSGAPRPAAFAHRWARGIETDKLHNLFRAHFFAKAAGRRGRALPPGVRGWEEWRAEAAPGVARLAVSVVIPSFARPHNLMLLVPRVLQLEPLRRSPPPRNGSEVIISHGSAESLATRGSIDSAVARACAGEAAGACSAAQVVHVDSVALNQKWYTAHRYHAAARARNDVLVHLDDDLVPGERTLQLLIDSVALEKGFPHYAPPHAPGLYGPGGYARSCGTHGYGPKALGLPHFVLTNFAACSRELNARYLSKFVPLFAPMLAANRGNGEDLTYAFHTRSIGGLVYPHGRCQTNARGGSWRRASPSASQAAPHSTFTGAALHKLPSHGKLRSAVCTCLHSPPLHAALVAGRVADGSPPVGAALQACVSRLNASSPRRFAGRTQRRGASLDRPRATGGASPRAARWGGGGAKRCAAPRATDCTRRRQSRSCAAVVFLAVSLTSHANVTAGLRERGLLCNRAFNGATSHLTKWQLRAAFRQDVRPGCVEVMDFDGGLHRFHNLKGHVRGLCAHALILEPYQWFLKAFQTLQMAGDAAVKAMHRHPYFARRDYQARQVFHLQSMPAKLSVYRDVDHALLLQSLLRDVSSQAQQPNESRVSYPDEPEHNREHPDFTTCDHKSSSQVGNASFDVPDLPGRQIEQVVARLGWKPEQLRAQLETEIRLYQCIRAGGITFEFDERESTVRCDGVAPLCQDWILERLIGR